MRKKILVADDEEDTITVLRDVFEEEGYEVIGAGNGEETLEAIRRETPDVLLLDLRLPRLSGEDILEEVCKDNLAPDMKIMILTGFSDFDITKERIQRKFGERISQYLEKPVDIEDLCRLVERHLAGGKGAA